MISFASGCLVATTTPIVYFLTQFICAYDCYCIKIRIRITTLDLYSPHNTLIRATLYILKFQVYLRLIHFFRSLATHNCSPTYYVPDAYQTLPQLSGFRLSQ